MSYGSDRCEKHGVTRCMLCKIKERQPAGAAIESDIQAQEAAARLADTTVPDVDFGDVEAAWNGDNPAQYANQVISVAPHVEAVTKEMMKSVTAPGPGFRIPPAGTHLAGNPIVDAAAAYTSAQADVDMAAAHLAELESDLSSAKARLEEVRGDRDIKKQVLQALVGGAS
jgi:hypothetical protein